MDGLDEVPTRELRLRVQSQLGELIEDYPKNRLILTCRTQIIDLIPDGFTSVEVADFSAEQVKQFVQNWFTASGKSNAEALQQWETFENAVGKNPALKELTVTPVLLSLMCLVLQHQGEMTSQIDWLYKKGIRLLLSRWNDAKAIDAWEVGTKTYRRLNVEQKEALLIEIAVRKFENPNNFVLFEQEEITDLIANFLRLANRQEGIAVLKGIEAQHGLLIERADELWSFSHLSFQEHFTIRWLTQLPSEKLAEKIGNQRWQEVVKQLVKSQQPVDPLLQLIKQTIHRSIKSEPVLQNLLSWVVEKSESIPPNYQAAAIRAFYFALAHPDGDLILARALKLGLDRDFNLARDFSLACNIDLELATDLNHNLDPDLIVDRALIRTLTLTRDLDLNRANSCTRNLDLVCTYTNDPKLANRLRQFREKLPTVFTENQKFQQWWQANGKQWIQQLYQVMIEHRNIGHDWQFSDAQKQQLQRYYDANKFLVELIKIKEADSNTIRTEIENNILLPWEELQRRSEIYRQQ